MSCLLDTFNIYWAHSKRKDGFASKLYEDMGLLASHTGILCAKKIRQTVQNTKEELTFYPPRGQLRFWQQKQNEPASVRLLSLKHVIIDKNRSNGYFWRIIAYVFICNNEGIHTSFS
jgi:hypothetical protein